MSNNKPTVRKNPLKISGFQIDRAEREGFEPPVPLGTPVFKTGVIDHSTISPERGNPQLRCKDTTKSGM